MDQYSLTKSRQKTMDKYVLLKDIPCAKAGTIFVHDKEDNIRGSIAQGCLKLAWGDDGNCQNSLVADAIVFHASAIKDKEWFKKVNTYQDTKEKLKNKLIGKLEEMIEIIKND